MISSTLPQAPFIHSQRTVGGMMREVLLALTPAITALTWQFGIAVLINIIFACICCWLFEFSVLKLRNRSLQPSLSDCSALLTGALIATALPPLTPWWLIAIAALFAIVFAKHLYGGLGFNLFNPAMAGFAVLLVSFPAYMAWWPTPDTAQDWQQVASYFISGSIVADAISGATPLDVVKTELNRMQTLPEILSGTAFSISGSTGWIWINLMALLGGVFLLVRKIISWHIPVGVIIGLGGLTLIAWIGDSAVNMSPSLQLLSGGTMLGIFFIATDPVSSCSNPKGKLIYGAGIGILTYIIRTWGAYPDGFAFAVLIMNLTVPIIDRYTRPSIYGQQKP
ncbi:MAG: RnfABCDGE type electron transport complex subunit D [Gammaproteobacteria bacterium]|nr:RnfABCDGE type electron transport complex subunit D [Gammaproteobacteria bacterium]